MTDFPEMTPALEETIVVEVSLDQETGLAYRLVYTPNTLGALGQASLSDGDAYLPGTAIWSRSRGVTDEAPVVLYLGGEFALASEDQFTPLGESDSAQERANKLALRVRLAREWIQARHQELAGKCGTASARP